MAGRVYRTARGESVDMTTMLTNNETVPAVGNMRVNARGDEIASDGTITKTRNQIMQEYHNLSTMVPQDGDIPEGTHAPANQIVEDDWEDWEPQVQPEPEAQPKAEPAKEGTNVGRAIEAQAEAQPEQPSGGLAAAVKAQQTVESAAIQPVTDKSKDGVRRI